MINFLRKIDVIYWIIITILIIIVSVIGYLAWLGNNQIISLNQKIESLNSNIALLETSSASTTAELKESITQTHTDLSLALNNEKKNVGEIEELLGTVKKQNEEISGTVTTLQKLSDTDPELLQKYSKVFFLSEHYAPSRMTEIPDTYEYNESKFSKLESQSYPYLENMLKASLADGLKIYVYSAYRSYEEQSALKSQYTVIYGSGTANQFSADQGYSEHQLGTAVDLITTGLGGALEGFDGTLAYQWLLKNAYRYGFVLSYPKDNKYYVYEPWHWRFVGVKLATYLHNNNKNFYDLEQREIDKYLVNLFE